MVSVVDRLESVTDEDRGYADSRFADVVDALFATPINACGAPKVKRRFRSMT
jgi:hypothetical protein